MGPVGLSGFSEIFIRREIYPNEHRTPLVPKDVRILVNSGIIVHVQSSKSRVYKDKEYEKAGAFITPYKWFFPYFIPSLILGIKELDGIECLDKHSHAYFSHSFKKQKDSEIILAHFSLSRSKLYDFEYLLDMTNNRIISFGIDAGQVGAVLGLLQHLLKLPVSLSPWDSFNEMINSVKPFLQDPINIGIIGGNGRCGKGVQNILNLLKLPFTIFSRNSSTDIKSEELKNFDIIYNCITLDETYNKVWFNKETKFVKKITIVDISCDVSKSNNPIQLYDKRTTWESPVYNYNDLVSIIAIENLPSLLPKESSDNFSSILAPLLLNKNMNDNEKIWNAALELYYNKTSIILSQC